MKDLTVNQLQNENGGLIIGPSIWIARGLYYIYRAGYDAHNNNCGCPPSNG
ncbi:MAG: hypothetical protein AAF433_19325 [Bacteroidota bacterium]